MDIIKTTDYLNFDTTTIDVGVIKYAPNMVISGVFNYYNPDNNIKHIATSCSCIDFKHSIKNNHHKIEMSWKVKKKVNFSQKFLYVTFQDNSKEDLTIKAQFI